MNIPAIKRNAAGANSMPPEIASPLVQPPAMPAPYSRMIAPMKSNSHRSGCGVLPSAGQAPRSNDGLSGCIPRWVPGEQC